jgi:methionyl-tRNA formyltransferase
MARVIFCGTPDFAVPSLRRLIDSEYCPELVITQPDRPADRGHTLKPPPVKQVALEAGLPIYQPQKFNCEETWRILAELQVDLAVVVAYSAKIGQRALASLPLGWLNLHPSLLPAYRGAAPMQWALIHGQSTTGISTFLLNEQWDAGPICLQQRVLIETGETYGTLAERCSHLGADLVLESVRGLEQGSLIPQPQDDSKATFAPLLTPADSLLDFNHSAEGIVNRLRGLSPKPGLYTTCKGRRLYLTNLSVASGVEGQGEIGQIEKADRHGFRVWCGQGLLEIHEVRPENKGTMTATAFLNGYRLQPGDRLG